MKTLNKTLKNHEVINNNKAYNSTASSLVLQTNHTQTLRNQLVKRELKRTATQLHKSQPKPPTASTASTRPWLKQKD